MRCNFELVRQSKYWLVHCMANQYRYILHLQCLVRRLPHLPEQRLLQTDPVWKKNHITFCYCKATGHEAMLTSKRNSSTGHETMFIGKWNSINGCDTMFTGKWNSTTVHEALFIGKWKIITRHEAMFIGKWNSTSWHGAMFTGKWNSATGH